MLSAEIIGAARNAQTVWGIPACVGLAQCILESDAFTRMPEGSCNGLGIKELPELPFVTSRTMEVMRGRDVPIIARFAKFSSIDQCFYYWGKLIASNPVYRLAFKHRGDWKEFVRLMSPHYATDPEYAVKLIGIIEREGLDRYNV